jgi:hypothetical protein
MERFTSDPLSGRFAGYFRDCRPAFSNDPTYLLQSLPGARQLSEVFDLGHTYLGIGSGVYENSLGGRVAVMGYSAWGMIQTLAKSTQIKTLFRWLSHDRFPAYIDSFCGAALWVRTDAQGKMAFLLVNTSLDPAPALELVALTGGESLSVLHVDNRQATITSTRKDGPYDHYTLPALRAWEMVLITESRS